MGEIEDLARESARVLDEARHITRGIDNDAAWDQIGVVAGVYLPRIVELATGTAPQPTPPEPTPPTPSTAILGYYGTYSGHGLAQDVYLGYSAEQASWGAHHGIEVLAPKPGRVELYQFGTPLQLPMMADAAYAANQEALFTDWVCMAPPGPPGATVGGQTMFVAVYWPDGGIALDDGSHATGLGFGHVRGDISTGRVVAGQRIVTIWDSGIRFENSGIEARAAHVHLTIFRGTSLSPNGDVDGRLALGALGWHAERLGSVPGPQDYMGGAYCAGRRLGDFRANGKPIPTMPS